MRSASSAVRLTIQRVTVPLVVGFLPLVGTMAGVAAEPDSSVGSFKVGPPRISGYLQTHFRYAFATGADSLVDFSDFRVQRVRVAFEGDVNPWLSYDVEIDPRAPEINGVLRDAYATFRFIPRHRLRVGQQKTQFGYENSVSSTRLFAVNRTEVSDALSRGINLRDVGIGLLGNVKLGSGWRLEDAITIVNGAGFNVQADDTKRKNVWGRVGLRYKARDAQTWVARFGVSGAVGDQMDEGIDPLDPSDDLRLAFRRIGTDFEFDHDRVLVTTEYVLGRDEDTATGETDDPSGYYVNVVGKTRWNVGPIVRYDVFADDFERWTLGGFYGEESAPLRLLVNYELRTRKDGVRGDDKLYAWMQVRFQ